MANTFAVLDVVTLMRDLPERNLRQGAVGTVLEILGSNGNTAYEVEFINDDGVVIETFAVSAIDLAQASDAQRLIHSIYDLLRQLPAQRLRSVYDFTRFIADSSVSKTP